MIDSIRRINRQYRARKRNTAVDISLGEVSVALPAELLTGCRVFPDRYALISSFPKNGAVVEVGVAEGMFSEEIIRLSDPRVLYLIDAWGMGTGSNYGEVGFRKVSERFAAQISAGRIVIRRGYSHDKLRELENNTLDWIYVDASHDYESVRKDLEISLDKIVDGGIISGHDYCRWGRNGQRFGVLEAVNEFCVSHHFPLIGLSLENNYNWSYAIQIRKDENILFSDRTG